MEAGDNGRLENVDLDIALSIWHHDCKLSYCRMGVVCNIKRIRYSLEDNWGVKRHARERPGCPSPLSDAAG
jgi:hypothetical protein